MLFPKKYGKSKEPQGGYMTLSSGYCSYHTNTHILLEKKNVQYHKKPSIRKLYFFYCYFPIKFCFQHLLIGRNPFFFLSHWNAAISKATTFCLVV